jgi:tetraacyldisaccharide-1-P 4'-kinase
MGPAPQIPLVVVGALRSGGSGKTSVTLELARESARLGMRPAILAYRLGPGRTGSGRTGSGGTGSRRTGSGREPGAEDPMEVLDHDDWRASSEEAVMLRRETGLRVFVTRDRSFAWRRLHESRFQAGGAFDILISDDGFQDPRLDGALRLLLTRPGERPGLFDLLPGGPFRETWTASARADLRLEGPYPHAENVTYGIPPAGGSFRSPPDHPPALIFRRRLILPPVFDRDRPWIVFCALGDNRPFLLDLAREGIHPVAVIPGRNHAAPPIGKLQAAALRHPEAGILCTGKDFLKLEAAGAHLPLRPVGQAITLDPEIMSAVKAYRLLFKNGYLVHYPR